jgi:hypothetical protein
MRCPGTVTAKLRRIQQNICPTSVWVFPQRKLRTKREGIKTKIMKMENNEVIDITLLRYILLLGIYKVDVYIFIFPLLQYRL